jgi:LuxR family maltose regulon positive regulatory protein
MSLLQTKLHVPSVRPGLVPRPHLIERLNAGLHRKLTLISTPAGFGKTTLLSEWVADCGRPIAWLSLDEGDDDPARFLAYFVAAIQTVQPDTGQSVVAALKSSQPLPTQAILTTLINDVAAMPERFALVLDDYHLITARPVHKALTFLLDHLPNNAHLVIATRADPPLPIARLRGRGQLTELRQADLRFTPDEASAFLNNVMRLDLSPEDVAVLEDRTEGWIAGLQMAAVSMRGQEDVAGFIRAFTGSDRYILDYLVEEVLQRQPASIQTFLLQTSILGRLTGPLCDAVCGASRDQGDTGQGNGQHILEQLEQANLFIVPLDNERRWYRYHRLFADLLLQQLQQTQPDLVPTLHRRASAWHEHNGPIGAAIDHALSAGDSQLAVRLVEQAAEATFMRSEIATFLKWVAALPEDVVRTRPRLCVFEAGALLLSSRPLEDIESRLRHAAEADAAGQASGERAVLDAMIASLRGDLRHGVELAHRALEFLPEDRLFLRNIAASHVRAGHLASGDVPAAIQAFGETARKSQKAGNLMVTGMALRRVAELHAIGGRLHKARAFYEQALESAVDGKGRPLPVAGMALIGLGGLFREWNDLEAATRHLTKGIELVGRWGELWSIEGYIFLAHVKQALGDVDGARAAIQSAQQQAIQFDASEMDDIIVAGHQARLSVAQGNLEAATQWVEERGLDRGIGSGDSGAEDKITASYYSLHEFELTTLARVHIAQGRLDEALAVLKPLLQAAERLGRMGSAIEILALQALALRAQGDALQATTLLRRALSLAEPAGYVRTFIDEGAPMGELLRQMAARGTRLDYVSKLLAALESETADERRTPAVAVPLVEPLSGRELQVLRLLTTSLSSTEIAGELLIAVSTVRSHIKSIYGKLNVHRRMEAIQRAKELGLL